MRRALGLIVAAVALAAPTFAGARGLSSAKGTARPVATSGVPLRLAMPAAAIVVDPALVVDENNAALANLLYTGLVRLDAHYQVEPAAAARWSVSPDHRTYTFYLRPGLRFSDGDPITAYDFQYSIQRSLRPTIKSPSAPTYLLDIAGATEMLEGKAKTVSGIRVINRSTLQITARWPVPYFLMELTYPTSYALDKKRLSKLPIDSTAWYTNPVTSGPYRLKSWVPNSQMVLVRNKYFTGPAPSIKQINISFDPLPQSALYQYVTRNLDVASLPANDRTLAHQPGVHTTAMLSIDGVYMNFKVKPFDKVAVRRALVEALNREQLVTASMHDSATPFGGFVPPGQAGYDGQLKVLPYNVKAAQAALAAAGFRSAKTFPDVTLYYNDDPVMSGLANAIAKQWHKNLGIRVVTQALMPNALVAKAQEGTLSIYILGWSADYPDPHDWLSLQWETGVLNNNVHFHDASFDRQVEAADVTWSWPRRLRLYNQAQQILVNDAAWIPLYIPHRVVYVRPGVKNLEVTGYGVMPSTGSWAVVQLAPSVPKRRGAF